MTLSRNAMAATLALTTAFAPLAATAQGNGPGKGHANSKAKAVHATKNTAVRHNSLVVQNSRVDAVRCPPGLAKKSPACKPPGQAKKRGFVVGDVLDWNDIHVVSDPGLYGLSVPPDGSRYAIVGNRLVRVDSQTGKIQSIIRLVEAILD